MPEIDFCVAQYKVEIQHFKRMTNTPRTGAKFGVLIILVCVIGAALTQTFQYSRGWTNGKKRGSAPSIFQDSAEGSDVLGVCQMMKLREILAQKRKDEVYLPCEVIGKQEDEIMERFRRKTNEFDNATFENTGNRG